MAVQGQTMQTDYMGKSKSKTNVNYILLGILLFLSMLTTCNSCRTINIVKVNDAKNIVKIDSLVKIININEENRKTDTKIINLNVNETILNYLMYSGDMTALKNSVVKMREDLAKAEKNRNNEKPKDK